MVKTNLNKGFVTQIIGPVLDIKFSEGNLPPIYTAISIEIEGDYIKKSALSISSYIGK